MMHTVDLSGMWECSVPGQSGTLRLPGTLDEAGFGLPDDPSRQWKSEDLKRLGFWKEGDPVLTRLTRKRVYEGPAQFSRSLCWSPPAGCRIFLECERTRHLRLTVNGLEAPVVRPATLSAPCVFDVTDLVIGQDRFTFISDNSYPGWPRDAIVYASAASDETQTNWNGILGYIRLRIEKANFISGIRVYPGNGRAEIRVDLNLSEIRRSMLRISSPALLGEHEVSIPEKTGAFEIRCSAPLHPDLRRWDLEEGFLYPLTVSAEGLESRTVTFGVRTFRAREGRLELNGRKFFLRGETNCAVFPETGYIPADTAAWTEILLKYRSYGVNCVRFHSHCPPEAAFFAADRLGMLMQPELSHWDPEHAFASEKSRNYYGMEARRILRQLANHPSFVMLSFGNELQFHSEGRTFAENLLRELRREDPTRLYTAGSNAFYGTEGPNPADDYYTACEDRGRMLRASSADFQGWLNRENVYACRDYNAEAERLRDVSDQPVLAFEAGQYEVLPDFRECADYRGVTEPMNLRLIEQRMHAAGLADAWSQMVSATGGKRACMLSGGS